MVIASRIKTQPQTQPQTQAPPRRDNRRPQLLDAAARNFREQGYAAASMRDIAAGAGMKAGSMYYYFASKADLLIAVHEEGIRRISAAVDEAVVSGSDPWSRLRAAMSAHLSVLLDGGDYAQVVIRELPLHEYAVRERLVPLRDEYEARFAQLFDDLPLVDGASRRHLRLLVLGALNWSQTWYRPGGDTPTEIAGAFLDLLKPLAAESSRQ
ncbi:MAG: TetR/AcrR family transcriptional regulator, partial [Rhodospirillaceae bacterium]|nr:TetR/AcrR family transcriptional regulator [Rhodospirillaceae bacterium]